MYKLVATAQRPKIAFNDTIYESRKYICIVLKREFDVYVSPLSQKYL